MGNYKQSQVVKSGYKFYSLFTMNSAVCNNVSISTQNTNSPVSHSLTIHDCNLIYPFTRKNRPYVKKLKTTVSKTRPYFLTNKVNFLLQR